MKEKLKELLDKYYKSFFTCYLILMLSLLTYGGQATSGGPIEYERINITTVSMLSFIYFITIYNIRRSNILDTEKEAEVNSFILLRILFSIISGYGDSEYSKRVKKILNKITFRIKLFISFNLLIFIQMFALIVNSKNAMANFGIILISWVIISLAILFFSDKFWYGPDYNPDDYI